MWRHTLPLVACAACATATRTTTDDGFGTYEHHAAYVNFVPFGAGQFQNDEPGKGIALAIGEAATLATSAGIWLYLTDHYHGGPLPISDAIRVRHLQQVEVGAGVAFFALYAFNVIDAVVHYEPRVKIRGVDVGIVPILEPSTAGVALSWRTR